MSIATLKRKTFRGGNPRIDPISGANNSRNGLGFNINGVLRLGPSVGPTNLAPFANSNNRNSCLWTKPGSCVNDSNYIKTSVKNTRGMLASRRICNTSSSNTQCPKIWVQPFSSGSNLQNTQGQFIRNKRQSVFNSQNVSFGNLELTNRLANELLSSRKNNMSAQLNNFLQNLPSYINNNTCNYSNGNCNLTSQTDIPPGTRNLPQRRRQNVGRIITNNFRDAAMNSSEYTQTLYLARQCIPVPFEMRGIENVKKKISWPRIVNNRSCAKTFKTPEEYFDSLDDIDCNEAKNILEGNINSTFISSIGFNDESENNLLFVRALIPFLPSKLISELVTD